MSQDNITDISGYLRAHATELGERILSTFPPMQNTTDPVAPRVATLLRKALPAQALAITGTAKYLRTAKAARIVAECGAGKTYMALGAIHVLADGRPSTTLVMCPSHITHKWAREVLATVLLLQVFIIVVSIFKKVSLSALFGRSVRGAFTFVPTDFKKLFAHRVFWGVDVLDICLEKRLIRNASFQKIAQVMLVHMGQRLRRDAIGAPLALCVD